MAIKINKFIRFAVYIFFLALSSISLLASGKRSDNDSKGLLYDTLAPPSARADITGGGTPIDANCAACGSCAPPSDVSDSSGGDAAGCASASADSCADSCSGSCSAGDASDACSA